MVPQAAGAPLHTPTQLQPPLEHADELPYVEHCVSSPVQAAPVHVQSRRHEPELVNPLHAGAAPLHEDTQLQPALSHEPELEKLPHAASSPVHAAPVQSQRARQFPLPERSSH